VDDIKSFFDTLNESKADETSTDTEKEKQSRGRGQKRKLTEETRITTNLADDDSYYQWQSKRRRLENDTRQSVTSSAADTEPFGLNSDNATDAPYEPTIDTSDRSNNTNVLSVAPVERKKSPARSDGDFGPSGERTIRRIDFAALRKQKEEARIRADIVAQSMSKKGNRDSPRGRDTDPVPRRQTGVRELKRPGIARSMTRVTTSVAESPPKAVPKPSPKKKLQTLTTDNFFDTVPSVFVPKKAPATAPPKAPAPKAQSQPKSRSVPPKNSGGVLDNILSSMQK
jgi:hypothetical protein